MAHRDRRRRFFVDTQTSQHSPSLTAWLPALLVTIGTAATASAQIHVRGWGMEVVNSEWHWEPFAQIAAGNRHTLALRGDGTIAAWGDNYGSPVGGSPDLGGQCSGIPPLPPGLVYVDLDGGHRSSVALRSDGKVVVWGSCNGWLCSAPGLPPGVTYVQVALGNSNGVALRSDGTAVVWGSSGSITLPPPLPPGLVYVEIEAGGEHGVARRSDGTVVAWGQNNAGQCNTPDLPPGLSYVGITAGQLHTMARRSDGSVVAWGDNSSGQCNVPPPPPGLTYVDIVAGEDHSLGLLSDGSVVAWGSNSEGQCDVPTLPAGQTYVELAAGNQHSVARRNNGLVDAWGSNASAQCNIPPTDRRPAYVQISANKVALLSDGSVVSWGYLPGGYPPDAPVLPPGLTYVEIASIGFGYFGPGGHPLARRSDGSAVGWFGNNGDVPALPPGLSYVEIAAGSGHSVARRSDGSVIAWGANGSGQCNVPALPAGLSYVQIAAGDKNSAACRSDGVVVGWGAEGDIYGQSLNNPPPPPPGVAYVEVATSGYHTLGRLSDGSVVAWGSNMSGECNVPAPPPGLTFVEIAATGFDTYPPSFALSVGRLSDGSILAWGDPHFDQHIVPPLPPGYSYVEIAAAPALTYARFQRTAPPSAPVMTGIAPGQVDALDPGEEHTVTIYGEGFDRATELLLDGVPIDPARYAIHSDSAISLDMPQVERLGVHELAVTDGVVSTSLSITVGPSGTPKLEIGQGNAFNLIDRDEGLTCTLSGPVGSMQVLCLTRSSLPEVNASRAVQSSAGLFTSRAYVIPAKGWLQVDIPGSELPAPGIEGTLVHARSLQLSTALPLAWSNAQSVKIIR
jgi:alpha-tubulin suppressor-like RCC1 family protein